MGKTKRKSVEFEDTYEYVNQNETGFKKQSNVYKASFDQADSYGEYKNDFEFNRDKKSFRKKK